MDNGDGMRETRAISSACMHAVCTHTDGKVMSSRLKCGALVSDWQWQLSLSDCRAHREDPRGLIDHGQRRHTPSFSPSAIVESAREWTIEES